MRRAVLLLFVLTACKPTATTPDDTGPPTDTGPPPTEGDALVYLGSSDAPSFWESTDVAVVGAAAFVCTGVRSLTVFDASDAGALRTLDQLEFSWSHRQYARCSHLDTHGDALVVTSEPDEIQPDAGLALLDISTPTAPMVIADLTSSYSLGQPSLGDDRLLVAVADAGVLPFERTADSLVEGAPVGGLGNVISVLDLGDRAVAGSTDGTLHFLDDTLQPTSTLDLPAALELLDLGDGRIAVAMGSGGVALVDLATASLLGSTPTQGIALRLGRLGSGDLLVTNWSDVRVYDVTGDSPELIAVDAVFQAGDQPRMFGAAANDDLVVVGEWMGVHALRFVPNTVGPELTPSSLVLQVADDGQPTSLDLGLLNEGQVDLVVSAIDAPSGWSASPGDLSLAPGEAATVTLDFEGATAIQQKSLTITSNDPDEPSTEIGLQIGSNAVFVGDEALDFSYVGVNTGLTHALADQRGSVVLLSYFSLF